MTRERPRQIYSSTARRRRRGLRWADARMLAALLVVAAAVAAYLLLFA